MRWFLRPSSAREPLPVTMSGVRMGERVLQIGVGDRRLTSALAAKPGMSGHAAIVVEDDDAAARAAAAASDAGALVDVQQAPLQHIPFDDETFDVVILHDAAARLAALGAARDAALGECRRVLRPGGRLIAFEPGTRTGLGAMLHRAPAPDPQYEAAGGTTAALERAHFRPVRLLADREGCRFIEGLRG